MDKVLYGIAALAAAVGALFILMGLSSLSQPLGRQPGGVFIYFTCGFSALVSAVIFAAIGRIIELLEVIAKGASAPATSTKKTGGAVITPEESAAKAKALKERNASPLRGLLGKS